MFDGLVFGWRTALLTVVVVQLVTIAIALPRVLANNLANRSLAALLVVLAGILTPWLIGFAGFYDRWPWLTFAPFAVPLAVAPLFWFYVHALVSGRWPARPLLHLTPAAMQFGYMAASFMLPMPLKDAWSAFALGTVNDVAWLGTAAGLAGYGALTGRLLSRYRILLAAQRSDDVRYAARWLSRAAAAMLVLLPVWAIYAVWNAVSPLGYLTLMGLHVGIAVFALYLAIEGWRHAALRFPPIDTLVAVPAPAATARDWRARLGLGGHRPIRELGRGSRAELGDAGASAGNQHGSPVARAQRGTWARFLRLHQWAALRDGRCGHRLRRRRRPARSRARRGVQLQGKLQPRFPGMLRHDAFGISPDGARANVANHEYRRRDAILRRVGGGDRSHRR